MKDLEHQSDHATSEGEIDPIKAQKALEKAQKKAEKERLKEIKAQKKVEVKEEKKKLRGVKRTTGSVMALSIGIHALLGLIATYLVVQHIHEQRKVTFAAGPTPEASKPHEYKVQAPTKHAAASAPNLDQRITTTAIGAVTIPDAPALPSIEGTGTSSGSKGGGMPQSLDIPSMDDMSMTSVISPFGGDSGLGLEGTFYDIKQTSEGQSTNMTVDHFASVLRDFNNQNWDKKFLDSYFKGPHPIYLSQVLIPFMQSTEGPAAFGVPQVVPKMWIAVYRGRVAPPASGRYRFVGYGDDVIAVRLNGKLVFDGGICRIGNVDGGPRYKYMVSYTIKNFYPFSTKGKMNLATGAWFDIQDNETAQIEIMIGEQPGGDFMQWLLIEKDGATYDQTEDGCPILPPFRISNAAPSIDDTKVPIHKETIDPLETWRLLQGEAPALLNDLK